MRIGELARRTGTTTKTLRFYEDAGLLPETDRLPSGYRDYPADSLDRVGFIRLAQAAGFTLRQIGQILHIQDGGHPTCEHVAQLVAQRLDEVQQRIAELRQTEAQLRGLARRVSEVEPAECTGYCIVITNPEPQRTRGTRYESAIDERRVGERSQGIQVRAGVRAFDTF
jgi:MerR family copper efflux transcriptional regulator